MNYFVADIIEAHGIKLFSQLPAEKVRHIKAKPEGVRSYIILLFPYYNEGEERNVARFAAFPDYHTSVEKILKNVCKDLAKKFPKEKFLPLVDNSPVAEVHAAVEAGLGVLGKNNLLINRLYGSYCFIAEIATTMELSENISEILEKKCLNCGACIRACPTGALSADGFSKDKCLSHITQKKGALNEWEQQAVKSSEYIWGCDKCQEVCCMNFNLKETVMECFRDSAPIVTQEMIDDPEFFDASAFAWRKKETIMRNINLKTE